MELTRIWQHAGESVYALLSLQHACMSPTCRKPGFSRLHKDQVILMLDLSACLAPARMLEALGQCRTQCPPVAYCGCEAPVKQVILAAAFILGRCGLGVRYRCIAVHRGSARRRPMRAVSVAAGSGGASPEHVLDDLHSAVEAPRQNFAVIPAARADEQQPPREHDLGSRVLSHGSGGEVSRWPLSGDEKSWGGSRIAAGRAAQRPSH